MDDRLLEEPALQRGVDLLQRLDPRRDRELYRLPRLRVPRETRQKRLNPLQECRRPKRLGQVIVGATLAAPKLLMLSLCALRIRKGIPRVRGSPLSSRQSCSPIISGISTSEMIRSGAREDHVDGGQAIGRRQDGVPGGLQDLADHIQNQGAIIRNQDARPC